MVGLLYVSAQKIDHELNILEPQNNLSGKATLNIQ